MGLVLKKRQQVTLEQWESAGLFTEYWGVTWDPAHGDAEAYALVQTYKQDLKHNWRAGKGLVLYGPPGTGKTFLGHSILAEGLAYNMSVRAYTAPDYLRLHHRKMDTMALLRAGHKDAGDEWKQLDWEINRLRGDCESEDRVDLLLLDDLDKEFHSQRSNSDSWATTELDNLLRARGNRKLPTIITSNLDASRWAARYSDSFESFLHQTSYFIPVEGEDYRMSQEFAERKLAPHLRVVKED